MVTVLSSRKTHSVVVRVLFLSLMVMISVLELIKSSKVDAVKEVN